MIVHDWFGWPDGAVLTNLVASLIWGVFAWRKLHAIHKSHKSLHEKFEASLSGSADSEGVPPERPLIP